ncbi:hypothetical protein [Pedobacter gandavensis]|uniref:Glycogen debranching enzyme C-terminal domain-containing protein n=1 Tax=Pedobacter gandavensis TaxID=2679963 RepID=A0ABR6EQV9_9SPHI|nr:hypothetical protein [Pedobacter gandavensis]MBB2147577.1 hypothetical protein [Pedobacter gandavensis]
MKFTPIRHLLFLLPLLYSFVDVHAQDLRWHLVKNGGIAWTLKKGDAAHTDQIEMSGKQISAILTYGVNDQGSLVLKRKLVFPMLRTIPNNTRGTLIRDFDQPIPTISIDGVALNEQPVAFAFNGSIKVRSTTAGVNIVRELFPSVNKPAFIEQGTFKNKNAKAVEITIPEFEHTDSTKQNKGVYGIYVLNTKIYGAGRFSLKPGETLVYSVVYSARKVTDQPYEFSSEYEAIQRRKLISDITKKLVLKTPDDTLNQMFSFAKIRASESIFDTKGGLLHSPGGGDYYAGIWANDQAEYMNPLFPFLGNAEGNQSAINSFRMFAKYMNAVYKPIPSSIIAEGDGMWNGAGDRGDMAMIAYGASRFALAYGDTVEARKLWPLIEWCLEFSRRKKSKDGVIASDSDELEGRFPAGKINLSTNTLAYGALVSSSDLAASLGDKTTAEKLALEAAALRISIEKYFGAKVQGYDTYRYYDGNDKLRSWIGMPLVMGMYERKEQTAKALLSNHLWTKDGMLSESGSKVFWDRSLLYAVRGLFNAGITDTTLKYFKYYTDKRLLGEHVPYAVEAWPEGNQRHLSAESGLYCRAITEGLFGIQPKSFNSFLLQPHLPADWKEMSLEHISAFNEDFGIRVLRAGKQLKIIITQAGGKKQEINWTGRKAVEITLN